MDFLEYLTGMGRLVRAKASLKYGRNGGVRRSRRSVDETLAQITTQADPALVKAPARAFR
jgi:hypothetical protein